MCAKAQCSCPATPVQQGEVPTTSVPEGAKRTRGDVCCPVNPQRGAQGVQEGHPRRCKGARGAAGARWCEAGLIPPRNADQLCGYPMLPPTTASARGHQVAPRDFLTTPL